MKSEDSGKTYLKLVRFCLYRERCAKEVYEKMHLLKINLREQNKLCKQLVEDGYLSEKRFANAFVHDKFSLKRWGKNRILFELKMKAVPQNWVDEAMEQIEDEAYENMLLYLAEKKWKLLEKEENHYNRIVKTKNYLVSKGYEFDLIDKAVKKISQTNE